jgi:hypothetical protein
VNIKTIVTDDDGRLIKATEVTFSVDLDKPEGNCSRKEMKGV